MCSFDGSPSDLTIEILGSDQLLRHEAKGLIPPLRDVISISCMISSIIIVIVISMCIIISSSIVIVIVVVEFLYCY